MVIKESKLAWIVVSDLAKARKFFTETLGMKETSYDEGFGWIELTGRDGGSTLGVAKNSSYSPLSPGQNAVVTFTVEDLEKTKQEFIEKGVELVGEVQEVPDHVKMQLFRDPDGNYFQIVEML